MQTARARLRWLRLSGGLGEEGLTGVWVEVDSGRPG
jgi:hypothetical protein